VQLPPGLELQFFVAFVESTIQIFVEKWMISTIVFGSEAEVEFTKRLKKIPTIISKL
jgi:hypothetical protein